METRRSEDRIFWKYMKYCLAALLPFIGFAVRYGKLEEKTTKNTEDVTYVIRACVDLQQRTSSLEQAIKRIPEMDKKLDDILWHMKH